MNLDLLIEHVKDAEDSAHKEGERFFPYTDTTGHTTIGWGHNLEEGIDEDVAEHQLRNDINNSIADCRTFDYWFSLDSVRQLVVCDLVFNLGLPKWRTFVKANEALLDGDYEEAAKQLEDSRWYWQTKRRARKLVKAMRTGLWDS